jgi:ABC-type nitrate/sulfonate/bicarbonate transport system permease component
VLVPVVLLFLGVGDLAKIVIIFLILFFQILVLVRDQAAGLRPELIQSVRSLGAGRRALFRFVYLPASLPAILTGVRQSIGTAVAVLYVAELFATQRGLGYYIYLSGSTLLDFPGHVCRDCRDEPVGRHAVSGHRLARTGLCPWIGK